MAVQQRPAPLPASARTELRRDALGAGVAVLAAYDLALALFMAVAPHAFYSKVGPFGPRNDHYIRDTATFSAAIGIGLLISTAQNSFNANGVFAAMVILAVVALIAESIVTAVENRLIRWRPNAITDLTI